MSVQGRYNGLVSGETMDFTNHFTLTHWVDFPSHFWENLGIT